MSSTPTPYIPPSPLVSTWLEVLIKEKGGAIWCDRSLIETPVSLLWSSAWRRVLLKVRLSARSHFYEIITSKRGKAFSGFGKNLKTVDIQIYFLVFVVS